MPLDRAMFSDKLRRYRKQFGVSLDALAAGTGIDAARLRALEDETAEVNGDEVLIVADFFKCDYQFFISNEKLASFEQTESLFRRHRDVLSGADRWSIQEFLFLCECQHFLLSQLRVRPVRPFAFTKRGTFYKGHGQEAAAALRTHLGHGPTEVPKDVFRDFRGIGVHIFRRRLEASTVSGLFVRHPVAGPCVLVNYTEDVFRQRFTVAHEAGHAILDDGEDFVVSFAKWTPGDLSEVRANTFASHYLLPPSLLRSLELPREWTRGDIMRWCIRLMVNADALAIALKGAHVITESAASVIRGTRIPSDRKPDPELPPDLTAHRKTQKEDLLRRGLSDAYVGLCFDAYEQSVISAGRLGEMLLVSEREVHEIGHLYGRTVTHGS